MSADRILNWMTAVPNESAARCATVTPSKRRRLNPITPDPSSSDRGVEIAMSMRRDESPDKRPMSTDDATPKAPRTKRIQTPRSESSYSLSDQSRRSLQSSSEQASPYKHIRSLKHNPKGIQFRDLSHFGAKPPSLEALLETVDVIMEGKGIVSASARDALLVAAQECPDLKWAYRGSEYFFDDTDVCSCTPSPEAVLGILAAAAECSTNGHPEANWNLEVHQRVLELAFRPRSQGAFGHLVNFMGSTTATIIPDYGSPSPSKRIDFCIYIEPENDTAPTQTAPSLKPSAMTSLRNALPGKVLNFTDFAPLDQRPIAISIETKRPSEGFDGAKLQLGVWQMAHWAFLRHLAERHSAEAHLAEGAQDAEPVTLPMFIPGVIIQGHDWHLVITTLEGQQTLFWQKVSIGSTSSSKGIYQIIRTLQVLRQWASDTYWPCLRQLIFGAEQV